MDRPRHLPLACRPDAVPPEEREAHAALGARLFADAEERRDLPDGLALRFPAAALADVARFVDNERRCCPFVAFAIELAPDGGPLWLRLTGPEGTREVLAAELGGIARPAPSLPR
ncbi:MAG TPA: hypothetical protein VHM02_05885 [Thermoanaerobaculia bacterium]|nr:hypothetical protein [Thermoanaerobaculia bacterium]